MAVEGEEELERVAEEDLDGRVELGHGDQPLVGAVANAQHVLLQLQRLRVVQSQPTERSFIFR